MKERTRRINRLINLGDVEAEPKGKPCVLKEGMNKEVCLSDLR
ncbi:MAG: hypothetical protein ABIN66_06430 [candidate division WOR-3 bacterium]